jgi:NADH-quinone oxidoreductase subunit L
MGGLRRHLRFAYFTIGVGCLAIAGIPGFAGFFSKDEILAHALASGTLGTVLFVFASAAAFLTALYMFRLLFRVFVAPEPDGGYAHAPHGAGWAMSVPVAVLAALSIVGGWIQVPFGWHAVTDWLEPVFADSLVDHPEVTHGQEVATLIVSVAAALLGIALAWYLFAGAPDRRRRAAAAAPNAQALLEDAYRFDDVYDDLVVAPGRAAGAGLRDRPEVVLVNAPLAVGAATTAASRALRVVQSGLVRTYVFAVAAGLVAVAVVLILAVG